MPDRLMRRGSVYYFRARYPADLRHLFRAGDRWKSLRTSDFRKAKRRLAVESVRFDAEMAERRKNLSAPFKATLTPAEVDAIAAAYFHDLMSEDEDHRASGLSDHDYRVTGESIGISSVGARADLARGDVRMYQTEFDDWLDATGHRVAAQSDAHQTVLNRMLREFVRFLDAAEKRHLGDPIDTPAPPKPEETGPTVRELIAAYINDPEAHRTPKTIATYRIIFDALAELVGEDRPARDVTRADCERIRDVLRRLPSNARKKYPGVPLATAVELGAKDGAPTLSAGTVNAYLENLSSLFKWGVTSWRVQRNPAEGLSIHDPISARAKRRPIPLEALPAIFSAPLYTGCQNDEGGYAKKGSERPRRGRFWVPLLALFHGIRMSEACQLHTVDIQRMGETWVLMLNDETEEGKRLQRIPRSNPVEVRIISDNPTLETDIVPLADIRIIGRVCGVISQR